MERLAETIFNIVFILGFHINPSFSQSICRQYTYFDVPGARPSNPVTVANSNCLSYCIDDNTCNGFTTQQDGNCLLNTGDANDIDYNSTSSNYTAISRNANSCNTAQNCYYSWTVDKNYHGQNGHVQNGINTINRCIASCQPDDKCYALDWNSNAKACYIFNVTGFLTATETGIYHFTKNCSPILPTTTGPIITPPADSSPSSPSSSGSTTVTTSQASLGSSFSAVSSVTSSPSTSVSLSTPVSFTKSPQDNDWYPLAIKPAYIVLAGLGGGCLLLVITAVVILCEYPMNASESYSTDGVVVKRNGKQQEQSGEIFNLESAAAANVEDNPYYNRSEIDSPDLTKDTYLM